MYGRDDPAHEAPADGSDLIRYATVKSVDLANGTCVAEAGDLETGNIRWAERRMGKTRSWSPPSVGEQVLLFCPEGELAAAVVMGSIAQDAFEIPGSSVRELIHFDDGAIIAYDPEGHILDVTLPDGATVNLTAQGGINFTGDLTVTGTITANEDVIADGVSLKNHKHGQTQPGTGQTGVPA
jgi:phage baseplate assembly protein V